MPKIPQSCKQKSFRQNMFCAWDETACKKCIFLAQWVSSELHYTLGWFKPYTVVQKVWKFIVSAAYPICLIRLELHTKNFENPCMLKGGNSGGPFLLLWLLIEALRKKSFCLKILLAILQLMWILDIFIHKGPNFQKNMFGSILYHHRVLHMRL